MLEKYAHWIVPVFLSVTAALTQPVSAGTVIEIEEGTDNQTVEVFSDSAVVVESPVAFGEVFIANPEIADISTISGTTLYVLGKQPGRTTLMLIRADTSIITTLDVRVSPDVTELRNRLSDVLPDEPIQVLLANDGLVLSGTVSSPEAVDRAIELAGHYAQGRVSNLLSVKAAAPEPEPAPQEVAVAEPEEPVDPALVEAQIRQILPDEPVSVHELSGTLVLSGSVSSAEKAQQAVQIAELVAGPAKVSNLLTIAEKKTCNMRTRKGGEVIDTVIPCGDTS